MTVESFELSVEILLVVSCVNISVHANLIFVIRVYVTKCHCVPTYIHIWLLERDFLPLECFFLSMKNFVFVYLQFRDCHGLEIEEEFSVVRSSFQIEVDNSTAEIVVSFVERQLEVVLNFIHQGFSFLSLFFRQDYSGLELFIYNRLVAEMFRNKSLFSFIGDEPSLIR